MNVYFISNAGFRLASSLLAIFVNGRQKYALQINVQLKICFYSFLVIFKIILIVKIFSKLLSISFYKNQPINNDVGNK